MMQISSIFYHNFIISLFFKNSCHFYCSFQRLNFCQVGGNLKKRVKVKLFKFNEEFLKQFMRIYLKLDYFEQSQLFAVHFIQFSCNFYCVVLKTSNLSNSNSIGTMFEIPTCLIAALRYSLEIIFRHFIIISKFITFH